MTTIVNLPDKICPHCNGTKWITTSNKHICKNGNISIYHGYQCYTRNKENRLKQIDKKREDDKAYYKRYKANPENLKKIKERTSFRSVDHFIEYINGIFSLIFPSMCGKELYKKGRYSIYLKEYNISIIVEFDLNKNMGKNYNISIITILPGKKGNNIVKFIEL